MNFNATCIYRFIITKFRHENGTVNLWRADGINFSPYLSYTTTREFDGFAESNEENEYEHKTTSFSESEIDDRNDEWPPFKKVFV